jgi:dUTP pyrophosphatase
MLIKTGISIYIENQKYAGLILPRSGIGHKNGIVLGNLVGLIDSDYQGEIKISCWNRSLNEYTISPGQRIAQMLIIEVPKIKFKIVENFKETKRSTEGFGHTGK